MQQIGDLLEKKLQDFVEIVPLEISWKANHRFFFPSEQWAVMLITKLVEKMKYNQGIYFLIRG